MALRCVLSLAIAAAALASPGAVRRAICECSMSPVACESIWYTDAAFVGRVLGITPIPDSGMVTVRLIATEVFKGVDTGEVTVRTAAGGASCGFEFLTGQTYLVFAHRFPAAELSTSTCSRTRLVAEAAEDLAYLRSDFQKASALGRISGVATRYPYDERTGYTDPWAPGPPFKGLKLSLKGATRTWTTTTGAQGTYRFQVPAGKYRLFTHPRRGLTTYLDEGQSVTLADGRGCVVRDVRVDADGRLSGILVDHNGQPIPRLGLELVTEDAVPSEWVMVDRYTQTDDRGAFEFRGLPAGRHQFGLALSRLGRGRPWSPIWLAGGATTTLAPEQRQHFGKVRLPEPYRAVVVTGDVVDDSGRPVGGARVNHSNDHHRASGGLTDAKGRFTFSVLSGDHNEFSVAGWSASTGPNAVYLSGHTRVEGVPGPEPIRIVIRPLG